MCVLTVPERLGAVQRAYGALELRDRGLLGLVHLAAETLGVDYVFLSLVDAQQERFAAVGGPLAARLPASMAVEESVCQHLVAHAAPLLVPDLQAHPALRGLEEVRALGLRSYAGAPVRDAAGLVLGGFCVAHTAVRPWARTEAALLVGLADAAARELQLMVALQELERVRARERQRAEEQAALHRVAVAVARGAAPEQVLTQVAHELAALLGASAAEVLRFEGAGPAVAGAAGHALGNDAADLVAQVRTTGTTAVRADPSCAVVPVRVEQRTWGALVAACPGAAEPATVACLEQLADVVSLVVVNTETTRLLQMAARTDPLTGAANRRAFEEQLAIELSRVDRHDQPLLLALVDVDHFKHVNDRHGHQVGDRVLVDLSERVRSQLRAVDLLARVGGDEWALLLPETGLDEGRAVLERVRASVGGRPLAGVPVTVTAGLAVASRASSSAAVLYRAADRALYVAKAQGRDRIGVEAPHGG